MFAYLFSHRRFEKGLTYMAYRANQQLREDIWDYRYASAPSSPLYSSALVLCPTKKRKSSALARQPAKAPGTTALSLMQQAAEMFEGIEIMGAQDHEARAQSLCKSATERLRLAEKQRDASERARRELINDFKARLEEMSKAMQRAEKRIVAAEDHALAAEFTPGGRGPASQIQPRTRVDRRHDPQATGLSAARLRRMGKDGQITFRFTEIVSSPEIKNISLYQKSNQRYIIAHPVPVREGRFAIVTSAGMGCGGRW